MHSVEVPPEFNVVCRRESTGANRKLHYILLQPANSQNPDNHTETALTRINFIIVDKGIRNVVISQAGTGAYYVIDHRCLSLAH